MIIAFEIDPNDPTCNSYRPIMKCAIDAGFRIAGAVLEVLFSHNYDNFDLCTELNFSSQRCTDIPDVFKKMAKNFVTSKSFRKTIGKYIDPNEKKN